MGCSLPDQGGDMLAAVAEGASHPAVAALLGLGAAGLAGVVVAMAWNVHARQIRLAEQLARRQFIVTAEAGAAGRAADGSGDAEVAGAEAEGAADAGPASPVVIDGPETVVTGEQARYRMRPSGSRKVVSWAVGGGMTERRGTKSVTAVADVTAPAPPFTLRLFLQGWGLVVVAVLIVGFAGALAALGNFASSDFIALVSPLAALLGVVAVAAGKGEASSRPGKGAGTPRP